MSATMNRRERIRAAVSRKAVDRVPYAFWRHFPEDDHSPAALARATLGFQERWGSDFIKLTFAGGYAVEDWGCVEAERVEPDGHRPCARHAVNSIEDWEKIKPLDLGSGGYRKALAALERVVKKAGDEVDVVPTLFSPLSLARKLSGDRLRTDLASRPDAVIQALLAITDTQIRFASACLDAGAGGIFFSVQAASRRFHSEEEYAAHGEPYDRRILESLKDRSRLTILHAHGQELMFDRLATLPAHALNWDDRATGPSLEEGRSKVKGAVLGGLNQWKTLREGTPERVRAEVRDALSRTGGRGLILGPGCVLPLDIPETNLGAAIDALEQSLTP
jgi:uroporphyrinogen decarboxylase